MTVNRTINQGKEESAEFRENLQKIQTFRSLKQNWNQNDAEPFDEKLLDTVNGILINLIKQPKVFPTARQTIQFEFEKENGDYLEFEIGSKNTTCLQIINEEEKEQIIESDFTLFNKTIENFYA